MANLKINTTLLTPPLHLLLLLLLFPLATRLVVASQSNASAPQDLTQAGASSEQPASEVPNVTLVNEDELVAPEDPEPQASVKKELRTGEMDSNSTRTTTATATATTTTTTETSSAPLEAVTQVETSEKQEEPSKEQQQQQQQTRLSEALGQAMGRARESLPQLVQQAQVVESLPVTVSPQLTKSLGELANRLPSSLQSAYEQLNQAPTSSNGSEPAGYVDSLLPRNASLFERDSVDSGQLLGMDCHMRNLDYCVAGLMGSSMKLLPETNNELEVRCDELKSATSCMAIYNKRCGTVKIFSMLAPFSQLSGASSDNQLANEQRRLMSQLGQEIKLTREFEAQLLNRNVSSLTKPRISIANLMELCEPLAKQSAQNHELRERVFEMAKCINSRIPRLSPCFQDLVTAIQVFYEPRRALPTQPTCCAIARFRACSTEALVNICGLTNFSQFLDSLTGGGGGGGGSGGGSSTSMNMFRAVERVCRQATDHKSAYCSEVLPPSGMRVPQRRGRKFSKLARALDMLSFMPAAQGMGSL